MKTAKETVGLLVLCAVACICKSCLPDPLEVRGLPVVKPELVVSSQIIPDRSLVVMLTKTFGALDGSEDSDPEELFRQIAVNEALVLLHGPVQTDTLPQIEDGVYGGLVVPFNAGDSYTLEVKNTPFPDVNATTTVLEQVLFRDINAELYFNGFDDTLAQVTYSLVDPVGKNWYMINVQEVEFEDAEENLLNPRAFTRLIDDASFDSEIYNEQFRVVPRDFSPGDTVAVSLSNVSADYFNFLKLRQDNRFSFIEYLSEPVNYPSNINGGKGFFNLYLPDVRIFILE